MSREPIAVLRDDLQSHLAVRAWNALSAMKDTPERIEVLSEHRRWGVYRLVGAGAEGASVIAKCSPPAVATIELAVYEHVLPHVPVTVPRFYGSLPANGGEGDRWIFLEDLGLEHYSDASPVHLALTARWVARMHRAAAGLAAAQQLPDGGPKRYLAHLRAARDKIRRRLPRPGLTPKDVTMLLGVVVVLDFLEARWSRIEASCVGLPQTLVHGDFRPKNVHLRANGHGLDCYPIDWETAGWGVPAIDLTRIDVAAYWAVAREWQVGLELKTVQRLADLGRVFSTVAAIDWDSTGLRFESRRVISQPLASIEVLVGHLVDAAQTAGALE
ncbi:MAG: phosphotransferase family protein [Gemmatimonadales bacterium]